MNNVTKSALFLDIYNIVAVEVFIVGNIMLYHSVALRKQAITSNLG